MTREEFTEWLEQFTDEEINLLYEKLLEIRHNSQTLPDPQA